MRRPGSIAAVESEAGPVTRKALQLLHEELYRIERTTSRVFQNGVFHLENAYFDVPVTVDLAANAEGSSFKLSRADHKHDLSESISPTWTSAHTFVPSAAATVPLTIRGHATQTANLLTVETSAGVDKLAVVASGRVLVGTSPSGVTTYPIGQLHVVGSNTSDSNIGDFTITKESYWSLNFYDVFSATKVHCPFFILRKAQGTAATPADVADTDQLGIFGFRGWAGGGYRQTALITAIVNGTVSGTTIPTDLMFNVGTAQDPTEKMRLNSSGNLGIGTINETISARLHIISTGEQFRSGTSATTYWRATTASGGATTFDAVGGTHNFIISDPVQVTDTLSVKTTNANAFLVENATGTDYFYVDTTGGVRIPTGSFQLDGGVFYTNPSLGVVALKISTLNLTNTANLLEIWGGDGVASSTRQAVISWDGRWSFGPGVAAAQAGMLLGFYVDDSASLGGTSLTTGITSSVSHSATSPTSITYLNGLVGQSIIQSATNYTVQMTSGIRGWAGASNSYSAPGLSSYRAAALQASFGYTNAQSLTSDGLADSSQEGNAQVRGDFAHLTGLWVDFLAPAASKGLPTNAAHRPQIASAIRVPIQSYAGTASDTSNTGQDWAIYGDAPTQLSTVSGGWQAKSSIPMYPAVTGFMRVPYPRFTSKTGVRAMQLYWEPWANTSTIRGGGAAGDTYFDDGTNYRAGLYQYANSAWGKLIDINDFVSYEDDAVFYDDELVMP